MIYAAFASASSSGVDILTIAITAAVTAAGAVLAGLFGARIQEGREHRKWVRERRYDTYVAFGSLMAHVVASNKTGIDPVEPSNMRETLQAIFILGPHSMIEAADTLYKAGNSGEGYGAAAAEYQWSAAKVLKINQ